MGQGLQEKTGVWKSLLYSIAAPFLAGIVAVVGFHTQLLRVQEENVLFLLIFLATTLGMLLAKGNAKRLLYAVSMLATLVVAYVYNRINGYVPSPIADLKGFLGSICILWVILGLLTSIYAIILCIRTLLWGQEEWERLHLEHQENLKTYMQQRRTWRADLKKISMENRSERKEFWLSEEKKKRQVKAENQEQKRAASKKRLEEAIKQGREFPTWVKAVFHYLFHGVFFVGIVALFLIAPILTVGDKNIIKGWFTSLESFMGDFSNGDVTFSSAIAGYTLLFIATLSILYFAAQVIIKLSLTLWEKITNSHESSGSLVEFFNEYSTPISVLIVAISILTAFNDNGFAVENLPKFFGNLVVVVLAVMLFMVAVDAIRLVLTQCTTPDSLLRTSTHLFFTLLIESMMGIAIGFLTEIDIRNTLTSLFSFFIGGNRTSNYQEVENTLNKALHQEIVKIRGSMSKKTKSAFSSFHYRH